MKIQIMGGKITEKTGFEQGGGGGGGKTQSETSVRPTKVNSR